MNYDLLEMMQTPSPTPTANAVAPAPLPEVSEEEPIQDERVGETDKQASPAPPWWARILWEIAIQRHYKSEYWTMWLVVCIGAYYESIYHASLLASCTVAFVIFTVWYIEQTIHPRILDWIEQTWPD